jgi:CheY-like chemotaxis protein
MEVTDKNAKVLIVDDDEAIARLLRIVFEVDGFIVVGEARDGLEALAIAMRERPDFVVLDYLMPGPDGAKTALSLRAIVPGARIVAFSVALEEKPYWADAFLNKRRIKEVVPVVEELLEERTRFRTHDRSGNGITRGTDLGVRG